MHEDFSRDYAVEAASSKRFGLVVGAILLVFGAARSCLYNEVGWSTGALGGVGLLLVLAALVKPDVLEPAHRGWNRLGMVLHKITNPLFLCVMYAVAIIPTSLLMRASGADPMGLRRKPNGTYWTTRRNAGSTAQSLEKPF